MGGKEFFSSSSLEELANIGDSYVVLKSSDTFLNVKPCYQNNVKEGVRKSLKKKIKRYDAKLNGIVLGYKNVKVNTDSARFGGTKGADIIYSASWDCYVFQPIIGCFLKGTVNTISPDHIACVVHRFFNATILRPHDYDCEDWANLPFNFGDTFLFRVKDLDFTGTIPYIEGELPDEFKKSKPKSSESNPMVVDEEKSESSKKKRKRKIHFEDNILSSTQRPSTAEDSAESNLDFEFLSPIPLTFETKKHKKKSVSPAVNENASDFNFLSPAVPSPKVKKVSGNSFSLSPNSNKMDRDSSNSISPSSYYAAETEGDSNTLKVKKKKKKKSKEKEESFLDVSIDNVPIGSKNSHLARKDDSLANKKSRETPTLSLLSHDGFETTNDSVLGKIKQKKEKTRAAIVSPSMFSQDGFETPDHSDLGKIKQKKKKTKAAVVSPSSFLQVSVDEVCAGAKNSENNFSLSDSLDQATGGSTVVERKSRKKNKKIADSSSEEVSRHASNDKIVIASAAAHQRSIPDSNRALSSQEMPINSRRTKKKKRTHSEADKSSLLEISTSSKASIMSSTTYEDNLSACRESSILSSEWPEIVEESSAIKVEKKKKKTAHFDELTSVSLLEETSSKVSNNPLKSSTASEDAHQRSIYKSHGESSEQSSLVKKKKKKFEKERAFSGANDSASLPANMSSAYENDLFIQQGSDSKSHDTSSACEPAEDLSISKGKKKKKSKRNRQSEAEQSPSSHKAAARKVSIGSAKVSDSDLSEDEVSEFKGKLKDNDLTDPNGECALDSPSKSKQTPVNERKAKVTVLKDQGNASKNGTSPFSWGSAPKTPKKHELSSIDATIEAVASGRFENPLRIATFESAVSPLSNRKQHEIVKTKIPFSCAIQSPTISDSNVIDTIPESSVKKRKKPRKGKEQDDKNSQDRLADAYINSATLQLPSALKTPKKTGKVAVTSKITTTRPRLTSTCSVDATPEPIASKSPEVMFKQTKSRPRTPKKPEKVSVPTKLTAMSSVDATVEAVASGNVSTPVHKTPKKSGKASTATQLKASSSIDATVEAVASGSSEDMRKLGKSGSKKLKKVSDFTQLTFVPSVDPTSEAVASGVSEDMRRFGKSEPKTPKKSAKTSASTQFASSFSVDATIEGVASGRLEDMGKLGKSGSKTEPKTPKKSSKISASPQLTSSLSFDASIEAVASGRSEILKLVKSVDRTPKKPEKVLAPSLVISKSSITTNNKAKRPVTPAKSVSASAELTSISNTPFDGHLPSKKSKAAGKIEDKTSDGKSQPHVTSESDGDDSLKLGTEEVSSPISKSPGKMRTVYASTPRAKSIGSVAMNEERRNAILSSYDETIDAVVAGDMVSSDRLGNPDVTLEKAISRSFVYGNSPVKKKNEKQRRLTEFYESSSSSDKAGSLEQQFVPQATGRSPGTIKTDRKGEKNAKKTVVKNSSGTSQASLVVDDSESESNIFITAKSKSRSSPKKKVTPPVTPLKKKKDDKKKSDRTLAKDPAGELNGRTLVDQINSGGSQSTIDSFLLSRSSDNDEKKRKVKGGASEYTPKKGEPKRKSKGKSSSGQSSKKAQKETGMQISAHAKKLFEYLHKLDPVQGLKLIQQAEAKIKNDLGVLGCNTSPQKDT